MSAVPAWRLTGDWFDVCSCDIPCPCAFAQPPTRNQCQGVLAYRIREGHFGEVSLDGLNVVALTAFEGNAWAGAQVTLGMFIDDRADDRQQAALQTIFGGQAGGWPATFAELIGDFRGASSAPITVAVSEDLSTWRAEVRGKVMASAEALGGPTTPPGARVQLLNAPGSEVGPGQVATWGVATADQVDALRWRTHRRGSAAYGGGAGERAACRLQRRLQCRDPFAASHARPSPQGPGSQAQRGSFVPASVIVGTSLAGELDWVKQMEGECRLRY